MADPQVRAGNTGNGYTTAPAATHPAPLPNPARRGLSTMDRMANRHHEHHEPAGQEVDVSGDTTTRDLPPADPDYAVGDTVTVAGIQFTKHSDVPFPHS